jgi:hypothetical protein
VDYVLFSKSGGSPSNFNLTGTARSVIWYRFQNKKTTLDAIKRNGLFFVAVHKKFGTQLALENVARSIIIHKYEPRAERCQFQFWGTENKYARPTPIFSGYTTEPERKSRLEYIHLLGYAPTLPALAPSILTNITDYTPRSIPLLIQPTYAFSDN